jgi:serine protease Do
MKVGDWVLAIGSPFGLEQTVTAGIISATGRVFPEPASESPSLLFNDYLQTDAAINPGNSGGPLVSMNGEVVGINTFISTTTRANAGVGFAVPSHIFVNAYNQILDKGKVTRGYLGVNMNLQPFTPAMARFFGVKQGGGVLITGLSDESGKDSDKGPAAQAGMKPEDVVVEFDGKKIAGVQDLRLAVANTAPGKKVRVKVVRHGEEKVLDVTVSERRLEDADKEKGKFTFEERAERPKAEIGLEFDNVSPEMAREINLAGGAVGLDVKPGSLAEEAGLMAQGQGVTDIIVAANGRKIESAMDLLNIVKGLKSGEDVVLKFLRVTGTQVFTYYTSITKP